jgi:glutathione synthase/RimK-type ligase-like ATP-grasp enzyme
MYKIRVFSKQPSHRILRVKLPKLPISSVVRLGSLKPVEKHCIEINTIDAIKLSADKKLTKEKFVEAGVKTAPYVIGNSVKEIITNLKQAGIEFDIIAKSRNGWKGKGNYLLKSVADLEKWAVGKDLKRYIFEKYMNYSLEYRLHITVNGCFYACRKALRKDADKNKTFQRHADNTVWFLETNIEQFNKPNSWNLIIEDCVRALKTMGADILSFDVKVQSANNKEGKKRKLQEWFLIETNSASSMRTNAEVSIVASKYIEILPELIMQKVELKRNKLGVK